MSDSARPLTGKTALGTGASSGIGQATALALAAADMAIVPVAPTGSKRSPSNSPGTGFVPSRSFSTATDERACRAAVDKTLAEFPGIDSLVNAAGLMLLGPIVGADTKDGRRSMSTDVLGLMYMTHAVVPHLIEQRSGDVVIISSVARPGRARKRRRLQREPMGGQRVQRVAT